MEFVDSLMERLQKEHPTGFWYLLRFAICLVFAPIILCGLAIVFLLLLTIVALIKGSFMFLLWVLLIPLAVYVIWACVGTIYFMSDYL